MKAGTLRKGRGAVISPDGRFDAWRREAADDGWWNEDEAAPATELMVDTAKSVITYNTSPDIPYDRTINPYRGCEHGCAYCFARPSHAYLGLSPGLDFETKIAYKADAAAILRRELARKNYVCRPVALGINTDAWQPVERRLRVTRGILDVLAETHHPVTIVTKSALILRDLDLLADMARGQRVHVAISITTLDADLARAMEPRAASPQRRLAVISALAAAGVPTAVMAPPLIPALPPCRAPACAGRAIGAARHDGFPTAAAASGRHAADEFVLRVLARRPVAPCHRDGAILLRSRHIPLRLRAGFHEIRLLEYRVAVSAARYLSYGMCRRSVVAGRIRPEPDCDRGG